MVRLHFEGAAKGAVERVEIDIATVIVGGRQVAAERLSQAETVGSATALLAEPVLVGAAGRLWLTIGAVSPTGCLIARHAWRFEEIEPQWDRLMLRSSSGRRTFQEGPLAGLGPPRDLIALRTGSKRLGIGVALFCGPLPATGSLPVGPDIVVELEDPVLDRTLSYGYRLQGLPTVA